MTTVFYDPQNKQITLAAEECDNVTVTKEDDETMLVTFDNVEEIEFFWPDERIWRAV